VLRLRADPAGVDGRKGRAPSRRGATPRSPSPSASTGTNARLGGRERGAARRISEWPFRRHWDCRAL